MTSDHVVAAWLAVAVFVVTTACRCLANVNPAGSAAWGPWSCYVAPTSMCAYRLVLPDGTVREFEYSNAARGVISGVAGWHGRVRGRDVTIVSGPGEAELLTYRFRDGRLERCECEGKPVDVLEQRAEQTPRSIDELWPQPAGEKRAARDLDPWRHDGRLRLWYRNPNRAGMLFAECALLSLGLLIVFRRRGLPVVLSSLSLVASLFLMVMTGSRGSVLAFVLGGILLTFFMLRDLKGKRLPVKWGALTAGCALVLSVTLLWVSPRRISQDLVSTGGMSGRVRMDALRAASRMMVDAPDGWGWYRDGYATGAGKAYVDWYQPMKDLQLMLTMVSDHVNWMVEFGWLGRFAYIFGWVLLLLVLLTSAWRRAPSLPVALWAAFFLGIGFNRISEAQTLWLLPVGAMALSLPRIFKVQTRRLLAFEIAGAFVAATVIAITLRQLGKTERSQLTIRASRQAVFVKSVNRPDRWLVDDGTVFGGGLTANEIRGFYGVCPGAPGLGYVRSVFALPKDVHKLVLGGKAGWEFLMALNDGKFPADFNMPEKILFVSPPFPPSAIPELMLKNVEVKLVIGEFAAAYFEEYRNPPAWVTVVKGTELYQPDWMERVTQF